MKKALYRDIVASLGRDPGLRPHDMLIVLVENDLVDWSFGNGEAQCLRQPCKWRMTGCGPIVACTESGARQNRFSLSLSEASSHAAASRSQ
jgi:hypothetical protein